MPDTVDTAKANTFTSKSIIVAILAGYGSLLALLAFPSLVENHVMLLLAPLLLLTSALIRSLCFSEWFPLSIPHYLRKHIAIGCSWIVFYPLALLYSSSVWFKIFTSLIILLSVYQYVKHALLILSLTAKLHQLKKGNGRSHSSLTNHVYIDYRDAASMNLLKDNILLVATSLNRTHLNPLNTTTEIWTEVENAMADSASTPKKVIAAASVLFRRFQAFASPVVFITRHDLERFPLDFRQSVIKSACAVIVVPPILSDSLLLTDGQVTPMPIRYLSPFASMVLSVVRPHLKTTSNDLRDSILYAHYSRGPAFILSANAFQSAFDLEELKSRYAGYVVEAWQPLNLHWTTSIIAHHLSASAIPLAQADAALPQGPYELVHTLARLGLAPVADAYLRFRVSTSSVERYSSLLDCFEVIIKYSVFSLLDPNHSSWIDTSNRGDIMAKLKKAALGDWVAVLGMLTPIRNSGMSPFAQHLAFQWHNLLPPSSRKCFDTIDQSGLQFRGKPPKSFFEWIRWLTWLRNKTRGHGLLDESWAQSVWPELHRAFLDLCLALKALIIDGRMEFGGNLFSGWHRHPARSSLLNAAPSEMNPMMFTPYLRVGNDVVDLGAFSLGYAEACFTWMSSEKGWIRYLDYSNGAILERRAH